MLGTVAAIRGALDMTITDELAAPDREVLLSMAIDRLEILAEQLRDLAAGAPPTLVPVVDALVLGSLDIDDGTQVELFNAFNGTWANGFEIAGKTVGGYRVRRRSDGSLLPGYTSRSDLRLVEERGTPRLRS
jgi:hypothetical protein